MIKKTLCLLIILIFLLTPISYAYNFKTPVSSLNLTPKQLNKINKKLISSIKLQPYKTKTILFKVKNKKDLKKISNLIEKKGGKVKNKFEVGNIISAEIRLDKISPILKQEDIIKVSPEFEYKAFLVDSIESADIKYAWDSGYSGKNIKIAILDTGINLNHEMFKDKKIISKSFIENEDAYDYNGHGTHVAGIALGNGKYKGIAYNSNLINAKVLNKYGSGKTSEIIAGINWAVENKVDIISISFGSTTTDYDDALAAAIEDAISKGVKIIAASGNCRSGCGGFFSVTSPGNIKDVITVGAVDNNNKLAYFSSGDSFDDYIKPDFVAIGIDITSSWIKDYKTLSGTSMSTPFLAGIVALLLEKNKDLSQNQVKKVLEQSSIDLGKPGKDTEYGFGVINITKLLNLNEIPEVDEEDSENETQEYEEKNYTIQYGTDTPEEAKSNRGYHLKFDGSSKSETFWTEGESNWYYAETDCKGKLIFKLYDIDEGDDLDLYVHDWEVKLMDSSTKSGNKDEKVIINKNTDNTWAFYINILPYKIEGSYCEANIKLSCVQSCDSFSGTYGSCSNEGSYKREGNNIYECVDQIWVGKFLCWEKVSSLGDSDFCDLLTDFNQACNHNEYDCDSDGECSGNLECKGSIWGGLDGCCYSNEIWDSKRNKCVECLDNSDCDSGEKCVNEKCIEKTCADYNKPEGSCNKKGENKRKGNSIYECKKYETHLCWDEVSSLGEDDFCELLTKFGQKCNHNEYDCDGDTEECGIYNGKQLHCKGSFWTGDKGCCLSNEEWDTKEHKCKKKDGTSCNSDNECYSGYCVHNICRSSKPYCGDNYCDSGENYDNCPDDCDPNLGHDDYCKEKKDKGGCKHNEYDCDSDDECSLGLVCKGISLIYNDGCCYPYEKWDHKEHECYIPCSDKDNDGYGDPANPHCEYKEKDCDDNNKEINPGAKEKCNYIDDDCDGLIDENFDLNTNISHCGSCGNSCGDPNYYKCENGKCKRKQVCIVNGVCEISEGETSKNCPKDCYGDIKVKEIDAPKKVDQAQKVKFKVLVKNEGTYTQTLKFEGAIVPEYWSGTIYSNEFTQLSYDSITKCCPGNEYYDAVEITLNPNEEEWVEFNVKAPTSLSYDHCNEKGKNDPYYFAWDDSFNVLAGLYSKCGEHLIQKLTKKIKVNPKQCNNDEDCEKGEYCKFKKINSIWVSSCAPKPCQNVCDPADGYICENNIVYECKRESKDECYKKVQKEICDIFEICNKYEGTCDSVNIKTKLYIEDSKGVDVYKQPGDYLTVNLDYKGSELIQLEYNNALELLNCDDIFTITKDKKCKFKIKDNANEGRYYIRLKNGDKKYFQIIKNPRIIILTNKEKLMQRFNDAKGVNDLLSEAYSYANKNYGIVYDLNDYILTEHPFSSFNDYNEKPENTGVENEYSVEIGEFIKDKCDRCNKEGECITVCKDILILGDDFVVPYYRRNVDMSTWFGWGSKEDLIYSDITYIRRTQKTFEYFDELFLRNIDNYGWTDGKDVKIIYNPSLPSDWKQKISEIKSHLQNEFNPDIKEIDATNIKCSSELFDTKFSGATLIIIGTEKNNKAFNCMPFVAGLEMRDTLSLEKNPWDGRNYAIVINTEDIEVMDAIKELIISGEISKIKSENAYFFHIGVKYASYVTMGIGIGSLILFSGGTAAPAILLSSGAALDFIADSGDVIDSCKVNYNGFMWCGIAMGCAALPWVPSKPVKKVLRSFDDVVLNNKLAKMFEPVDDLISKYFKKLRKYFSDEAFESSIETIEDNIHLAKGTDYMTKISGKNTDDAIKEFKKQFGNSKEGKKHAIKSLIRSGKWSDFITENGFHRFDKKYIDSLFRGVKKADVDLDTIWKSGFKAENINNIDLMDHVFRNEPSIFISTTEEFDIAARKFATDNGIVHGYVFEIKPRSLNAIDVEKSLEIKWVRGELTDQQWQMLMNEREIAFIGDISPHDIKGAWEVDVHGNKLRWIKNPNFIK